MTTQNPSNMGVQKNADGGQIELGITRRFLKWLGANITLTGSGSATHTFPSTSSILFSDQAGEINALTGKTTPVDADMTVIEDSAASNAKKKVTWANIKATLKAYLDTLYATIPVTNTFTPTVIGTGGAGVGTYTTQLGEYYTIGNLVFFTANLVWTAHTGTGNIQIGALPSTSKNNSMYTAVPVVWSNLALSATTVKVLALVQPNDTKINLYEVINGAIASLAMDAAGSLYVSGCYIKA